MVNSNITFIVITGGHNAGMLSEPGRPARSYRCLEHKRDTAYLSPEEWLNVSVVHEGSWWQAWHKWLVAHSTKNCIDAPCLDTSLPPAPGEYVLQK